MKLFHITTGNNLPSILMSGLLIGQDNCIGRSKQWDRLFFTDDVEFIVQTQLTNSWIARHQPVILTIDVSRYQIKQYYSNHRDPPVLVPHEFICFDPISPSSILSCKLMNSHYISPSKY